jgi:hypothetical protein
MAESVAVPDVVVKPPGGVPVPAPEAAKPTVVPPVPAEPAKPAPPAEDPRVAQLVQKEQALVKQQQALKAERDRLAKDIADANETRNLLQQAKRDPETVAKKLWGDSFYETFTEMRLNGQKVTPDLIAASVDERLASYEKKQQEDREKQLVEQQKQVTEEQSRIVTQWREDNRAFVTAHGEEYELINLHGWQDVVNNTIEDHFRKTQKIMSTKEAADYVEQYLADAVQKSLATKKFNGKPPAPPEKPTVSAQPRTLTNAHGVVTAPPANPPVRETDEERIARAVAAGLAHQKARQG